jgi:hypothetical protein
VLFSRKVKNSHWIFIGKKRQPPLDGTVISVGWSNRALFVKSERQFALQRRQKLLTACLAGFSLVSLGSTAQLSYWAKAYSLLWDQYNHVGHLQLFGAHGVPCHVLLALA